MREFRCFSVLLLSTTILLGAEVPGTNVTSTLTPAQSAARKLRTPEGFRVDVFAAEPLIANPVSFTFDEKGKAYVVETHRRRTSVYDIRYHPDWLDADFAFRTVQDRSNFFRTVLVPENKDLPARVVKDMNGDGRFDFHDLEVESERIQLLEDMNKDSRADRSVTYAQDFKTIVSGVAAGIVTRHGKVWFTCIPDLWSLQDTNNNGHADVRRRLLTGFGVHISFGGHDLHGLIFGPDGKLYFSIADRGLNVETEQHVVSNPDSGAIMRCNPDGSHFELVATGLRNPQELAFDQYGNLWTGDNNGDGGDKARWLFVLEGADFGWHYGWQHVPKMGPWNAEKLWELPPLATGAYILPPVAHIGHGPAGLSFYPGSAGLPPRYMDHFFLCDFPGGVNSFGVKPKGAGFEIFDLHEFVGGLYPVDIDFGPDQGLYVADWIEGWEKTGKGRIFRIFDPAHAAKDPMFRETRRLISQGFEHYPSKELIQFFEYPDLRVRQEAQFTIAERGASATNQLAQAARGKLPAVARLHAIWALGQMAQENPGVLEIIGQLLTDQEPEVRAQAVKVLGERRAHDLGDQIASLLEDPSLRVRLFALLAIGQLHHQSAAEAVVKCIRDNAGQDLFLRHAGVMALTGINDLDTIATAAHDSQVTVRLAALLAMRRLERPEVASFLYDSEPMLVLEAARAIHDLPLERGMTQLAALLSKPASLNEPVLRRSINANLRVGKFENALMLAEYSTSSSNPDSLRAEALDALGVWGDPPKRDRVLGLHRPIPAHEARGATLALRSDLPKLVQEGPESVRLAAVRAATNLRMEDFSGLFFQVASSNDTPAAVRVQCVKALTAWKDKRAAQLVQAALTDSNEKVRKEAVALQGTVQPSAAARNVVAAIENGGLSEKQAAFRALTNVAESARTTILTNWLERIATGAAAPEIMLDVLDAARGATNPLVKEKLAAYEAALPKTDLLAPYRETLYGGDPEAGKVIFFERAETACLRCHKIKGEGGEVGPDVAGIGTRHDRRYILESILFPNQQIAAGYETLLVTLNSGINIAGILKTETPAELVLNSPEDGIVTIKKSDIKSRDKGLSSMPAELANALTKRDLRDLVEFLADLR